MKAIQIQFRFFILGCLLGLSMLIPTILVMSKRASETIAPTPTISPQETPTPAPTPTLTPTPYPTHRPTPKPTPIPTPSPTPTSEPVTSQQLDGWFDKYSQHYSIDRSLLVKIAVCESGLRPYAVNGPYGGMYQFSSSTWRATRGVMNLDPDPTLRFQPEEAIRTAAFKISTDGPNAWPHCK